MRRRIAPGAVVWLLVGAAYFLIPLVATFLFSLKKNETGTCCTLSNYGEILTDPQFRKTIRTSFVLALETIGVSLALLVPTVYWVNLKLRRLRPVIGFLALVPFVVPPIVLVVGLLFMLFALCEALYVVGLWLAGRGGEIAPGWSSLMFVLLIVGSGLMVTLSIVGIYAGLTYQEVKRRPVYIVQEGRLPSSSAAAPSRGVRHDVK